MIKCFDFLTDKEQLYCIFSEGILKKSDINLKYCGFKDFI